MKTYVYLFHNTVAQSIVARSIMDLRLVAERCPGSRVAKRWWEQEGLDFEGVWTADWEAEHD